VFFVPEIESARGTLFLWRRAKGRGQKAKSEEQRAKSEERSAGRASHLVDIVFCSQLFVLGQQHSGLRVYKNIISTGI
jgi:hypothetical protein